MSILCFPLRLHTRHLRFRMLMVFDTGAQRFPSRPLISILIDTFSRGCWFNFRSNVSQILVCKQKMVIKFTSSGFQKIDASRFVPHNKCGTKIFDEHDHIDRIICAEHTPAKNSTDIITRSPVQWNSNPDFTKVGGDVRDAPTCTSIGREPIVRQARQPCPEWLSHNYLLVSRRCRNNAYAARYADSIVSVPYGRWKLCASVASHGRIAISLCISRTVFFPVWCFQNVRFRFFSFFPKCNQYPRAEVHWVTDN